MIGQRTGNVLGLVPSRGVSKGVPGKNVLTTDGVHMNGEGNKIMARGVLKAMGASDAQLKKAEEAWAKPAADAVK